MGRSVTSNSASCHMLAGGIAALPRGRGAADEDGCPAPDAFPRGDGVGVFDLPAALLAWRLGSGGALYGMPWPLGFARRGGGVGVRDRARSESPSMITETQKIEFARLMDPIMEVGISLASYLSASRLRVPDLKRTNKH